MREHLFSKVVVIVLGGLLIGPASVGQPARRSPLSGATIGASVLVAEDECCGAITQGEFAILLAWALGLVEPPQGWTAEQAARELTRWGHRPERGWEILAPMREEDVEAVLRGTRFAAHPAARRGTGVVTRARARAIFREGMPITQGRFAQMMAQALAPGRSFTVEEAIAWLRARGLTPQGGWDPEEWMTERMLWEILPRAGWPPLSQERVVPEIGHLPVDRARAQAVLFERRDLWTQAMVALLLVKLSGLETPAGGWTLRAALQELERWNARPSYGWVSSAPLCHGDLLRLLRRIGVISEPDDSCRVVVLRPMLADFSAPLLVVRAMLPTPQTVRVISSPIFTPLTAASLIVPPPRVGSTRTAPMSPVPPEIVGPEIPSVYSPSRPRPGF